ncbi:hypothetical protein [Thermogladius calderae]|uniref:ECF transporter S component n=1 Tax=Thermogladius calderae TaxID=1200300 RepID=UPI00064E8E6C|nr:hypothetical protein [Thermogladius calderae]
MPAKGTAENIGVVASLIALSVILHLFNIPFPPAQYLLFDLTGIPLAISMFFNPRLTVLAGLPVFYIGLLLYKPQDPIGPFMKVAAEGFTILPFYILYQRRWFAAKSRAVLATALIATSRTVSMLVLNLAIDPFYFVLFKWVESYGQGLQLTLMALPYVCVFNVIIAVYVTWLSLPIVRELEKVGVLPHVKSSQGEGS